MSSDEGFWSSIKRAWREGLANGARPRSAVSGSNLASAFSGGTQSAEVRDTARLMSETRSLIARTPFGTEDPVHQVAYAIVMAAFERTEVTPSIPLGRALYGSVCEVLRRDGLVIPVPEIGDLGTIGIDEGVAIRNRLHRQIKFLRAHERRKPVLEGKLILILCAVIEALPPTVYGVEEEDDEGNATPPLGVPLADLCAQPAFLFEQIMATAVDDDVVAAELFEPIRERIDFNLMKASGYEPPWPERMKLIPPTAYRDQTPSVLLEKYLTGTGFDQMFRRDLPFEVPFIARFEHTHIVGGTGHGKTQLMQRMILGDLIAAKENTRGIIVIDSQGDMLKTLSRSELFGEDSALRDQVVLIDPTDIEFPVALNMFDAGISDASLRPVDRERILHQTIELYEYFFGALLGAELTARQGIVFKYLARLMLEIPGATIHTLRELMEDGEPFRKYMRKLPPTARSFFETRFFDRSFNETKKQVLTRLWGVLSNAVFDRMFSHPKSTIDLFSMMQDGKIILINTAKELLGSEGASILGRFFIALIARSALRRATVPAHERTPCFVYIDEAADYFDDTVGDLLNQARKYKVGMVLAHQNLAQLTPSLRASVASSTAIKFAGGVSAGDADEIAAEMRAEADFVQGMRKRKDATEFACFVRNVTPQALKVSVPLGVVERLGTQGTGEYQDLVDANRSRYCVSLEELERRMEEGNADEAPTPSQPAPRRFEPAPEATPSPRAQPTAAPEPQEAPEPIPVPASAKAPAAAPMPKRPKKRAPAEEIAPGRGGREHKYLQHLVKGLADRAGFKTEIEATILDGDGRVDVLIERGERRIACEISVTTSRDHELQNIEKCIAAGFTEIVLISADPKHLATMEKFVSRQLEDEKRALVRFVAPEEFAELLGGSLPPAEKPETVIGGRKVRVSRATVSPDEAEARRKAIARVLTKDP